MHEPGGGGRAAKAASAAAMAPRKAPAPGTADPAIAGGTAIRAPDYLMHIHEGMRQLLRRGCGRKQNVPRDAACCVLFYLW